MWQIENNEYARDFGVSRPHQGCDSGLEAISGSASGLMVQTPLAYGVAYTKENTYFASR